MTKILPLQIEDAQPVAEIAGASFNEPWSVKESCYFLTHPHRVAVGIFDPQRRLLCYFLALLVQGDLDIISLATRSERRRQGLAKEILEHILQDPLIERAFL